MTNLADHGNQVACTLCVMGPLCNSRAVANGAPAPVELRKRIAAGERFYGAGSPREAVFALRAGFAQVSIADQHGSHVVRFLLPGDAAGEDGAAVGLQAAIATSSAVDAAAARSAGTRGWERLIRSRRPPSP